MNLTIPQNISPAMNRTTYQELLLNKSMEETIRRLLVQIDLENDNADDMTWILASAFIIFTMQSGFGLLESGSVSKKSEANIMMKNCIDIICGGLSYWIFGYAICFGKDGENHVLSPFMGLGDFMVGTFNDNGDDVYLGKLHAKFFFQLSFATTATTIVSGAVVERMKLRAYIIFSFLNTISYVFPVHWMWAENGFLQQLGVVDIAGCGPVHILGGVSALIATLMLKPRAHVFDRDCKYGEHACPTNMVLGTFMLWWGWFGFNCGSTYGISGHKWKYASRAAVVTMNGSIGGSIWAMLYSYKLTSRFNGKLDIGIVLSGLLGGLVSVTAICAICKPWEGLIIGFIGGVLTTSGIKLLIHLKIDDPIACVPVHGVCGVWGLIAVSLMAQKDGASEYTTYDGIFHGGPVKFLGYQLLASFVIVAWTAATTSLQLLVIEKTVGLRVSYEEEMIGADELEHGIKQNTDQTISLRHSCCCKCSKNYEKSEEASNPTKQPIERSLSSPPDIPSIRYVSTNKRGSKCMSAQTSHDLAKDHSGLLNQGIELPKVDSS